MGGVLENVTKRDGGEWVGQLMRDVTLICYFVTNELTNLYNKFMNEMF